jgi:sporulation protein YlmC with PRC-barrel domain
MTKTKLFASVAVAALLATPAFAQTTPSPTSPSTSRPTAPSGAATSRSTMPSDIKSMKVSDLVGKNVYTANDEKIGDIDDVVVSKTGSKEPMAVIGVGGFLGIGEKKAAVPLDQLQVQADKIVGAGLTKDSLKQHAEFNAADYEKVDRNRMVSELAPAPGGSPSGSPASPSGTGSGTMGGSSGSSGMSGSGSSPSGSGGSMSPSGSPSSSPSGSPTQSPQQ